MLSYSLLLVVDVDELGVHDVVLRLSAGPLRRRRPVRHRSGRPAGPRLRADLYIASASLWLACVSLSIAASIFSRLPA